MIYKIQVIDCKKSKRIEFKCYIDYMVLGQVKEIFYRPHTSVQKFENAPQGHNIFYSRIWIEFFYLDSMKGENAPYLFSSSSPPSCSSSRFKLIHILESE